MITKDFLIEYSPTICIFAIAVILIWYFFIGRFFDVVLFRLGLRRFSSYHDEKRGMNEHIRLVRRTFKRMQKINRKYFFRLLTDESGEIAIEDHNGKRLFSFQCLITGEEKQMDENWLIEALHFKIISNAEMVKGAVELVDDRFDGEVPEYNKKVGDVSYYNMIIGVYNDWSIAQMDVESINAQYYEGYK